MDPLSITEYSIDEAIKNTGARLAEEIIWLQEIIKARFDQVQADDPLDLLLIHYPLQLAQTENFYDEFVAQHQLGPEEKLLLLLALLPSYKPDALHNFIPGNNLHDHNLYNETGGEIDKVTGVFYPTLKTFLFLVAGTNAKEYATHWHKLAEENTLVKKQIVYSSASSMAAEDSLHARLRLAAEIFPAIIFGRKNTLEFNADLPVKLLNTSHDWKDLVVDAHVLEQLNDFADWHHSKEALKEMDPTLKTGYVALFYGPSGTGKTMTAALMGKRCGLPVYRISVSSIVSKWVGETGKNIKKLFEKLKSRDCILFFDEADSLFGARTNVEDAQDKYANQEIATLLMEIEEYEGMIILATNLEKNIDKAFKRRINSLILFDRPGPALRKRLWEQYLPKGFTLHEQIDLQKISKTIDVTGANIRNIYKMCAAKAIKQGGRVIHDNNHLIHYSRLELWKEGRLLS